MATLTPTSSFPKTNYFDDIKTSQNTFKYVLGKDQNLMFVIDDRFFKEKEITPQELLDWPREKYEQLLAEKNICDYLHNVAGPAVAAKLKTRDQLYAEYWKDGLRLTDDESAKFVDEITYKNKLENLLGLEDNNAAIV